MKYSLFSLLLLITIVALVLQWFRLSQQREMLQQRADELTHQLADFVPVEVSTDYLKEVDLLQRESKRYGRICNELIRVKYGPPTRDFELTPEFANRVWVGEYPLPASGFGVEHAMYKLRIPDSRKTSMAVEFLEFPDRLLSRRSMEIKSGVHNVFVCSSMERKARFEDGVFGVVNISLDGEDYQEFKTPGRSFLYLDNTKQGPFQLPLDNDGAASDGVGIRNDFHQLFFRPSRNGKIPADQIPVLSYASDQPLPLLQEINLMESNRQDENQRGIVMRVRLGDLETR